jgi:hypothetical protein
MTPGQAWLAAGTLGLTTVLALAVLALQRVGKKHNAEGPLLGVPTGEVLVSLLSLGLVAALTFTGGLDMKIAGTLLGAHVGYHAGTAASRRRSNANQHAETR